MTGQEWAGLAELLRRCWRGEFTDDHEAAYLVLLEPYPAEQIALALRKLATDGKPWLPTVSEIIAAITADDSAPSWPEAYELIFGRRGCLRVPPGPERDRLTVERAVDQHEVLGAFVAAQGPRRLRQLPVQHEEYGQLERRQLREEWEEFVERAAARRRQGQPLLTPALHARHKGGTLRRIDASGMLALSQEAST